ncbi:MAG: thiol-activated cytolysin family protein [Bacteroidota bacterium]
MSLFRPLFCAALTLLLIAGCDSGPGANEENPEGASIGDFIQNLSYNADELLNVQSQDQARDVLSTEEETTPIGNDDRTCVSTTFDLKNNFEDIAILRPTQDVIWPGALVEANQSLLDGLPEPARFSRAPVKIRLDLPGIGTNGTRIVEDPDLANVQNEIDAALEWWNANAFQEGYRNASSSFNRVTSSFSSEQAALDVGLNVKWATGDVSSQFGFTTSSTRNVVMATYKQAFYTASFVQENGSRPEDVFGPDVTLDEVNAAFDSDAPPAYIASVTYGRIIMFRMETSSSYKSADVEAAFSYAAGADVDGDVAAFYEQILSDATVEVITLGGNAAVASNAVEARTAGDLVPIITGENAVYSRENPGVPISYTVKYLKDDQLAKLGYTTSYTAVECSTSRARDSITITLDKYKVIRDCDAGPGDFEFEATVSNGSTVEGDHSKTISLNDGESSAINEEITFLANRTTDNKFSVKFHAKERDDPPFQDPNYNDLNRSVTKEHVFGPTGWTNLADAEDVPIIIEVSKAASCVTELHYKAKVE